MKIITFPYANRANIGTEEEPNWVETVFTRTMPWSEANLELAKALSHTGEVTVKEVPAPETPEPTTEDSVWDELDAAYQEGVNGAYDQ